MTTYVVDANLLVLLAVGSYDIALVGGRHKRCREFDATDFIVLDRLLGSAGAVICTPHAMAEASNPGSAHRRSASIGTHAPPRHVDPATA